MTTTQDPRARPTRLPARDRPLGSMFQSSSVVKHDRRRSEYWRGVSLLPFQSSLVVKHDQRAAITAWRPACGCSNPRWS